MRTDSVHTDSVAAYLYARFTAGALGAYAPGRPIALKSSQEEVARWTQLHEYAHAVVTMGTTLGLAAYLCGLKLRFGDETPNDLCGERYLNHYELKVREVHEGTATATAWSMQPLMHYLGHRYVSRNDVEHLLPETYVEAGSRIFSRASTAASPIIGNSAREARFVLTAAILGIGIAAMSPPVEDCFFIAALEGHEMRWGKLREVDSRYRSLISLPDSVFESLGSWWMEHRRTTEDMIDLKFAAAARLAEAAHLPFQPPPLISRLLELYLPQLAKQARFVKPKALSDQRRLLFFRMQHDAVHQPERVTYVLEPNVPRLLERLESLRGAAVSEIADFGAQKTTCVHLFDANATWQQTLVPPRETAKSDIERILQATIDVTESSCVCGVVRPRCPMGDGGRREAGCRPLLTVGVALPSFDDVAERRLLFGEGGAALAELVLQDGSIVYDVVAMGIERCRPPTARERMYLWVIQNGLNASQRWSKYGIEGF